MVIENNCNSQSRIQDQPRKQPFCADSPKMEQGLSAYIDPDAVRGILLPRSMYNLDLHQIPNILVELAHQEVDIKQVIELPAFADHGIPQDIPQLDRVDIVARRLRQVTDISELDRRRDESGTTIFMVIFVFSVKRCIISVSVSLQD